MSGTHWTWQQGDEGEDHSLAQELEGSSHSCAHSKPHFPRVLQVSQNRQPVTTPTHKNCGSHHSHHITTTKRTTGANSASKTIEPENWRHHLKSQRQVNRVIPGEVHCSQKQWENLGTYLRKSAGSLCRQPTSSKMRGRCLMFKLRIVAMLSLPSLTCRVNKNPVKIPASSSVYYTKVFHSLYKNVKAPE